MKRWNFSYLEPPWAYLAKNATTTLYKETLYDPHAIFVIIMFADLSRASVNIIGILYVPKYIAKKEFVGLDDCCIL